MKENMLLAFTQLTLKTQMNMFLRVRQRIKYDRVPAQRIHAAHKQWLWRFLGTCSVSATNQPTCLLLGEGNITLQASPGSPKRKIYTFII